MIYINIIEIKNKMLTRRLKLVRNFSNNQNSFEKELLNKLDKLHSESVNINNGLDCLMCVSFLILLTNITISMKQK